MPYGVAVELFDGGSWDGDVERLAGIQSPYATGEMICQNLTTLNDRAASYKVYKTLLREPAIGYWRLV